ncbi:MAG TPA: nucleoside monophosphate kinase [Verrucomicrobiota bacterium]|nr:nucleoside monophosphate kinase [Verrucomicrobiota bacterium]
MNEKNDRATWLKGGDACCSVPPAQRERPYRFILLGAPGVGKGTQAELLCARLGTCHLSTGDVFRAAKCLACGERSPAIEAAMDFMRRGDLVPDDTVLDIVRERKRCLNCHGGFLLDGFPRTVMQAEALMSLLEKEDIPVTAVINYEMPIHEIVARLGGRRTCSKCKSVYHAVNRPPKVEDVCDQCGGELIQREDDRPEAIQLRMEVYEKSTRPLIDYFNRHSLLVTIPAQGTPEEIYSRTIATLNSITLTNRIPA